MRPMRKLKVKIKFAEKLNTVFFRRFYLALFLTLNKKVYGLIGLCDAEYI